MKLEIYSETCCEMCNEVIHNHFKCPVCNKFTPTDAYYDLGCEDYMEDGKFNIGCQECKTRFITTGKYYDDNTEWEKL